MTKHIQQKSAKIFFSLSLLATLCVTSAQGAYDYNGTPLNKNNITITPGTSSTILASYTQTINTCGLPDNSFGSLGVVTQSIAGSSFAQATLLQPDGKIIALGASNCNFTTSGNFALMRFNTTGSLDQSFGTNGVVTQTIEGCSVIYAALLQSTGKIVAVGTSNNNRSTTGKFALIQYINPFALTTFTASYGTVGLL
jgi:uncharacterized delta-60 repeat protein